MTYEPRLVLEVALTSAPFDANPVWVDLDAGARLVSGSTDRALGRAGIMELVLHNQDDAFNSWNRMSPWYGNLLTADQSSCESGITGLAFFSNCTIARTTSQAADGSASLAVTVTALGTAVVNTTRGTGAVPITEQATITALWSFKTSAALRTVHLYVTWFDAFGNPMSDTVGANYTAQSAVWTEAAMTATAPATARYVSLQAVLAGASAGEVFYLDKASIAGAALNGVSPLVWNVGGAGPLFDIDKMVRLSGWWNLLTAVQSSFEGGSSVGWSDELNCALTTTTVPVAVDGTYSALMTAVANGDMRIQTPAGTSGVAVNPLSTYTAVASFEAGSANSRSCRIIVREYDAGGTLLAGGVVGASVTDNQIGWVQASATLTTRSDTAFLQLSLQILSCQATEPHYVDAVGLVVGTSTTWSIGGTKYQLTGTIESIDHEWPNVAYGDVHITVVDAFKAFTKIPPTTTTFHDAQVAHGATVIYRLDDRADGPTVSTGTGRVRTALEALGTGFDGSIHGNAEFGVVGALPAEPGGAMGLGVDRLAYILISGAEPVGTTDFAVECWVFPRSFPTVAFADRIWSEQVIASQQIAIFLDTDGKIRFSVFDGTNGGNLDSSAGLTLNRWNHVVCSKIGTAGPANWKIVMNRVDVSTGASIRGTGNCNVAAYTSMIGGKDASSGGTSDVAAFDGFIDEFAIYSTNSLSVVQAQAHYDAGHSLNTDSYAGARLNALHDVVAYPAGLRSFDVGQFLMRPMDPTWDKPPLPYIQKLVESEGWPAAFFIAGDGTSTFQDRAHATPAAVATFSDTGTLEFDAGVGPSRNDRDLWTGVTYQSAGGPAHTVIAATTKLPRIKPVTDLLNTSDADVATLAASDQARLSVSRDRLDNLVIHPVVDPGNLWPVALAAELNSRVTVERTDFPGGGSTFTFDARIQGIRQEFAGEDWHTILTLTAT